jgi:hypothetical protein
MGRKHLLTGIMACAILAFGGTAIAESYDWQTIPLQGGGFVDGFLYHPKKAGILYARTDVGGMYRYDYNHARWLPLMDGFGKEDWDCFGIMTMAVDQQKPERLYATCGLYLSDRVPDGAVVRSEDMGASWQITRLPGVKLGGNAMGRGTGERLQVDPSDSNILWLGTNQDGLWFSHDQGKSFAKSSYMQKSVTAVLISGQILYVGSGEVGEGLFRSIDGGQTFAAVPGSPKMIPHQMALGPDGTLYVTFSDNLGPHGVTDGAVWKLKGDKWTDISPARPSKELTFGYSGLDLSPEGTLVVSTSDRYPGLDDLYISHDGGAHWRPVKPQAVHHTETHPWLVAYMGGHDEDAANRNHMGHWMDAVKINPFNPNELLYGTGYGVWMTDNLDALDKDGQVDFHFRNDNFEETVVLGLESPPAGPRVLMAAGDVGGTAFDDFSRTPQHGLFSPMNKTNQSVAFAALKPNIIVRSVDNETARGYISFDGSETWQPLPSAPAPIATTDWHNHRAGKLVISAGGGTLVWVPDGQGAYYSKDMGKTWTLSAGWPKPERGQEAIADPVNDAVFYAFDRQTGTVLVSRDNGASFTALYTLTAGQGQLRAVPGREGDLWLAAGTALYHGLKPVAGVDAAWQVTFGKAAPGETYPAVFLWGKIKGEEGLWRSDNAGTEWIRINDDAHRFGQMRAIAGDPREYGTLYISPDGRGTMVGKVK